MDLTLLLLHSISSRLSGRTDCKDIEYKVAIGVDDPDVLSKFGFKVSEFLDGVNYPEFAGYTVRITPNIEVFPDIHSRKSEMRLSVLRFIIINKFSDHVVSHDELDEFILDRKSFTKGVYSYNKSFFGGKRRWERVY